LRLEEAFAADPARLSPQERMFLLQEPFYLLTPKAEERFRSSHFDWRTLLALLGWGVMFAIAAALGGAFPSAAEALGVLAFFAGAALVVWQVAQIKHRWFRETIFPTLVPALRPLKPSPAEIEAILKESKRRGEQIGKNLDPRRLMAALAAAPVPLAPLAAATLVPPPPPPAPVRVPEPAPAPAPEAPKASPPASVAASDQASTPAPPHKPPGLKLKYGGVRLRFTAADGEIMLGRAPDANIVVSEQHVSRHHASIIWDDFGSPLLVNLSQIGTSVQVDGQPAAERVETSIRLKGRGRIGLSGEFAYAEEHQSIVAYEVKGGD
jgi:FHA domain